MTYDEALEVGGTWSLIFSVITAVGIGLVTKSVGFGLITFPLSLVFWVTFYTLIISHEFPEGDRGN